MNKDSLIYLFPIISTATWGISIAGGKVLTNNGFTSIEIVFGRFAIASLIFIPILLILSINRDNMIPSKEAILPLIGLSITGVSLNNVIFYYGLNRTDASMASLLVALNPLATMLSAIILLSEKMTKVKVMSIITGFVGVTIVLGFSGESGRFYGNLMIVIAVLIWGASFSFSKMASNSKLSAIAITGWSEIIGTFTLLPFVLNTRTINKYSDSTSNNEVIFWFLYTGIIASIFAYILHYKAIEVLGPGKVAPSTYIIPLSGVIASLLILDETIPGSPIIGFIFIIIATIMVQREK